MVTSRAGGPGCDDLLVVAKLIALVLPLGLDSFAVAAALGVAGLTASRGAQITFMFTAFEAGMPLVGLGLGAPLGHAIGGVADYVAAGLLLAFGVFTLISREREGRVEELAAEAGPKMLLLGLSISLDELAIGFTLGLLRLPVVLVLVLIAVQTVVLVQVGLRLGGRLSMRWREGAERLAGVVLACLGLVLLAEKLL